MSREQELIENLEERLKEIEGFCTFSLPESDLTIIRDALRVASRKDVTQEYARMLEAFECDFVLARDDGQEHGLDELQLKIENGDKRLLRDIELLEKVVTGIRYGKIKIVEMEAGSIEE
ncbi:hypothetical protein BRYFOR_07528 [Marvinbryantia formatexigens DSM 14469]|uniref:Uncharacterized protein n=1 Tax=Marvinbryantia formatexigens DSM 14469 TaxID=478749 RepID=C6LFW8_9FIRM|nr:hypothetical protein [Marvinbryantia formatexigens]EET60332.1 hypothetical protein BRYFOR_07528 [Marvinbryantia formatexigens DSM 14469]UWO25328.1 hypothetical protein NQ534_02195 [Marvinbryantia formatexigens DSM 14469]SDG99533.1 hypothetical protein SAMN05660368_03652 [Marvinbryantia formatexigens]